MKNKNQFPQDHDHDHHHTPELSYRDKIKIDSEHMLAMCPIILYHIVNPTGNGCLDDGNFTVADLFVNDPIEVAPKDKVWLYSTLSVILISLCGLLGVAVIPIMDKHYYHHVLQFLVALAVGTLAGDALLHLLPHAMMPTSDEEDIHQMMMWRGLAAVWSIVAFYFFERFLITIAEWRQRRQKQVKPSSITRVERDAESVSLNKEQKTCMHKYSDYPYCFNEIENGTRNDHHEHQHVEEALLSTDEKIQEDRIVPSTVGKSNGYTGSHHIDTDNNTISTSVDGGSVESSTLCNNNEQVAVKNDSVSPEEKFKIILR